MTTRSTFFIKTPKKESIKDLLENLKYAKKNKEANELRSLVLETLRQTEEILSNLGISYIDRENKKEVHDARTRKDSKITKEEKKNFWEICAKLQKVKGPVLWEANNQEYTIKTDLHPLRMIL